MHHQLRQNLPAMPRNMRSLPVDSRGYPVPFFVEWINGVPDFRVASMGAMHRCVLTKLCWICGKPLGRLLAFTIGPMCAINRISSEPPQHPECAEYAVQACPFLSMPKMRRRKDDLPDLAPPPGIMLERNPGVMLVWLTRTFTVLQERHGYLFEIGAPYKALWYMEGRKATRGEVIAAIESGLPFLYEHAKSAEDEKEIDALRIIAMRLIPKEN
jgi:hypothetical protein